MNSCCDCIVLIWIVLQIEYECDHVAGMAWDNHDSRVAANVAWKVPGKGVEHEVEMVDETEVPMAELLGVPLPCFSSEI